MKSIREIYKIGKGPSSSHTMGPERAARLFQSQHPEADSFQVILYGSLSKTGVGHGTDRVLREVLDVPPRDRAGEYLMMRLRTSMGIEQDYYERNFLLPFAPLEKCLLECKERGLAVKTFDGRWHLTPQGFLLSNSIISDLLLIQEQT